MGDKILTVFQSQMHFQKKSKHISKTKLFENIFYTNPKTTGIFLNRTYCNLDFNR